MKKKGRSIQEIMDGLSQERQESIRNKAEKDIHDYINIFTHSKSTV